MPPRKTPSAKQPPDEAVPTKPPARASKAAATKAAAKPTSPTAEPHPPAPALEPPCIETLAAPDVEPTPVLELSTEPLPEIRSTTKSKVMPTAVAADIGNHKLKLTQNNQTRVADSLYAEVIHASHVGELDDESTLVRYLDGDRTDLLGKQWVTGHDAQTYFTDTYQRAVDGMNNSGKVNLGLQLLLGNLLPPQASDRLVIRYLFATLPDVAVLGEAFQQAVKGAHRITQKTAHHEVTFTVEIQEIVLKEEGQGAIAYALSKGICVQGAWNATIDFGGGTTITQAYNERGQIVPSSRLVQSRGVNDLAVAITNDDRFRKHLGRTGDVGLVLEAMRDQTFKYGGQGFDFSGIYTDQHRVWLSSIALPAFRKLLTLQDRLKTTLLIGGGAYLAKSLERSSVVVCDRPDLVNVEGLMILAKIRLGEAN